MRALKADPIADLACSEVGSQDVVDLASRLADGRSPATVSNYLSHLSPVFAIARPGWGIPLDERAMADGIIVAKKLGLVGKSKQRDRRPTLNELDRLLSHFEIGRERRPETMPMAAILAFAVFSTRRQEEITLLRWDDLDIDGKRILVRDMKDPEIKEGNNVWCELPDEALRIAQAQPRTDPEIFPYNHRTVSANMTRATALLDIDNLHFHDLRHEGISRLFETGRTIPQAASVSGHRSWATLKRYAHLRQVGDKYAGWAWLDRLAPKPDGEDPAAGAIAPVAVGTPL
jgi:integrase